MCASVAKEAICTEAGEKTYTCTRCGDTITETIDAKGHQWDMGNEYEMTYLLNINTMKIHYPDCKETHKMKEKNKREVVSTIESLRSQGYLPCSVCNPRVYTYYTCTVCGEKTDNK